jgi:putative flippase GtrA
MRELATKFARFCLVGTVATALQFAVLIAGVRLLGADAVIASSAGYVAGAILSYALNYAFTYRSMRPHREAVPRFLLVLAIGSALNAALMAIQINVLGFHYLAAQVLATGMVLVWHFVGHLRWSFRS